MLLGLHCVNAMFTLVDASIVSKWSAELYDSSSSVEVVGSRGKFAWPAAIAVAVLLASVRS